MLPPQFDRFLTSSRFYLSFKWNDFVDHVQQQQQHARWQWFWHWFEWKKIRSSLSSLILVNWRKSNRIRFRYSANLHLSSFFFSSSYFYVLYNFTKYSRRVFMVHFYFLFLLWIGQLYIYRISIKYYYLLFRFAMPKI